jgi:hypothetical protein
MNDNNKTEIQSSSIEDLNIRYKLLKLEGGEEAFTKREDKYGFR